MTKKFLKTALVTGASKRIGRAIALSLADNGYSIVVQYNNSKSEALKLCGEIENKNVRAWPIKSDFSRRNDLESLMSKAISLAGPVSVLINNASIFQSGNIDKINIDDFNINMLINAWAPFYLSRAFADNSKRGVIINITDARIPGFAPKNIAYSLSKSVLQSITEICAAQFAPHIRVNGVAPGLILPPAGENDFYMEKLRKKAPLCKQGTPQDVADAIVFLVKNPFITGEILYIDGGRRHKGYCTT